MRCFSLLFIGIITFLLQGCFEDELVYRAQEVRNLTNLEKDSLLDEIQKGRFGWQSLSSEEQIRYAILLLAYQEEKGRWFAADSLLTKIFCGLEEGNDFYQAQAYFYAGRNALKKHDWYKAEEYFLSAKEIAEEEEQYGVLVKALQNLARLSLFQKKKEKSLVLNRQAYQYACREKDSLSMPGILRLMGRIFFVRNELDSALIYYHRALSEAERMQLVREQSSILHELSNFYKKSQDYGQAEGYAWQAVHLIDEEQFSGKLYRDLGAIFLQNQQYDSARYYLQLSVKEGNLRERTKGYALLYETERQAGHPDQACYWADFYVTYQDSLKNQVHEELFNRIKDRRKEGKLEKENMQLLLRERENRLWFYRAFCAILLVFSLGGFFFIRNRLNYRRYMHKQREALLCQEKDRLQYEKEITRLKHELLELQAEWFENGILGKIDNPQADKPIRLSEEEWNLLVRWINRQSPRFTERLKESYPQLTVEDIRLCCLLKLKLKISVIARILSISTDAVLKRKYRLKKEKLNAFSEGTLEEFLWRF